ncbi:MAG: class I SAM-dependent methyltransferase [Pseudonocardiaceae bacterium]
MTSEVARFYEMFPFPSPEVGMLTPVSANEASFLGDVGMLADNCIDGWQVLDAGCGTGHNLVARALRYPKAHFIGVDACQRSVDIARHLAENNSADNIEFVVGSIPDLDLSKRFDMIICFGVLHHMANPRAGLHWLGEHLADDGLLHLWLYNALGEHGRMLDRELVQLFTSGDEGKSALETVRVLGLTLSLARYGLQADWPTPWMSTAKQDVFDADAYLNPIVQPMRFTDVPALFEGLDMVWVAADQIYSGGGIKGVDLGGTENDSSLFVGAEELFDDISLRQRVRSLDNLSRMQAIELRLRPAAFMLLAGRGDSLRRCVPRIRNNLLLTGRTSID